VEKKVKRFIRRQRELNPDKEVQVWYQDEARFGQKGIVSKVWASQGMRPTIARQNGFKSAYYIGAVNPVTGDKYSLIYDGLDTEVMNHFLKNISENIGSNIHIIMVVDCAGWHRSEDLVIPSNISLYYLPPYSPELNPIEQIWSYLKSNFLSGRIFKDMNEIFTYGMRAWAELTNGIIQSICTSRLV
jgi:transposase